MCLPSIPAYGEWASAVWDTDSQKKTSYFSGMICEVFEYLVVGGQRGCAALSQRHEILHLSGPEWVECPSTASCVPGPTGGDGLSVHQCTVSALSEYITMAIRLDNLLCQQCYMSHLHYEPQAREDYSRP